MPSGPEQAVAALAEWEGVGAEQYDEMINRMSVADVALPGSLVHVAGPVANGWRVFDVWESPEALDRFRRGTLMPILEQAGFPIPKVWTWPVYNALSPPTEEVRASRLRIIAAQNAERRRLERNLHDGAQQSLIALKIKLNLAAALAESDPAQAGEVLRELESDAQRTLESLRELARGLYPALLEQHGLVAALDAQARRADIAVVVDATDVRRYAQEIEAAVYFSCSRPCRTRRSTRRHPDCALGYANETAGSRSPSRTTAWDSIPSLNRELAVSRTSPTGSRLQEGRYRSGRRPGRGPP